jgi:hypothetical protein
VTGPYAYLPSHHHPERTHNNARMMLQ